MRRGRFIVALVVLLVAGGITALVWDGRESLQHLKESHFTHLIAMGLFFLAAAGSLIGFRSVRGAAAGLTRQLRNIKGIGGVSRVAPGHPDLADLTDSMNEIFEFVQTTLKQAEVRVKELDIQLKVATAERQHAQAIIYSISDAVMVTDPFDELVLANDTAARAFDFELEQATRTPLDRVLRDQKMIELIRDMRKSNSRNARRVIEHQVNTPVGPRTYKVTLSCVAAATAAALAEKQQGGIITRGTNNNGHGYTGDAGVVAVLHDISRERELAQMRNDFVSSVSHELRTPLASIKAYAEMLIDGEANDEKTKAEFYEVIQNEANRLERLIDNILNISRIESGLVQVKKRPESLMVLVKEAIEVITPQARQKQINIEEQLTPAFYQTLVDKDMMYQAVLNLLSNAVKYTPHGGSITVNTLVDEARKKVVTKVSDTGVGIPPKDVPFVFDKFYRSEHNNQMAKGTGLGLSLVKHIVETVHHGEVFVESTVGKGTTFSFELDLI